MSFEHLSNELANLSINVRTLEDQVFRARPTTANIHILDPNKVSRAEFNALKEALEETRAQLAAVARTTRTLGALVKGVVVTLEEMHADDSAPDVE